MKKTLKQHFEKIRNTVHKKEEELQNMLEQSMAHLFSQVDESINEITYFLGKFEGVHK